MPFKPILYFKKNRIVKKNKNRTYEFGNAIRLTQNSYVNKHKNITSVFKNKKFGQNL